MGKRFDYTTTARSFAFRFPLMTRISIQINYWCLAYVLLITVMYLNSMSLNSSYDLGLPLKYMPSFWAAMILGIIYGTMLGLLDWRTEQVIKRNYPLGLVIVVSSIMYLLILLGMLWFLRYVIWDRFLMVYFYQPTDFNLDSTNWSYIFMMVSIYSLVLAPGISFINQMNKKFGHGRLIPLLMGKYRQPQEERRLFMFLDLKSSTKHAENLGHLRYSALIRDSFMDISRVLVQYGGEIYQYVGDEMVINWLMLPNFEVSSSIEFFFAVQDRFHSRREHYLEQYGLVPKFKAGMHLGIVTAVEVGEIKREIAYHGDTINTAARIQALCNQYGKDLLISETIVELLPDDNKQQIESIGLMSLRGKEQQIRLYSVLI